MSKKLTDQENDTVYINGQIFHVIKDHGDWLEGCRPNGVKIYPIERLPDSPLYGEKRGRFAPWRALETSGDLVDRFRHVLQPITR